MSGYEPFYIDTGAFRQMGSSYANLSSQLDQLQMSLVQLSAQNPAFAATIAPPCEGLVIDINITVQKIISMHMKAQQTAAQIAPVSQVLRQTISYLNETAEDMEQVESEARRLAQNWADDWMNSINTGE